jgi:3-phenylpropionate/cinnamic acid dioxygenase small subunit
LGGVVEGGKLERVEREPSSHADGEDLTVTKAVSKDTPASPGLSVPERVMLQHEVEQFLYCEAALLDDRRFEDWLDLIADDMHYWMPIRRTVMLADLDREFTKIGEMSYFDDDRNDLRMRVEKLRTGDSWSEDPPSRTRHLVSNIRITDVTGDDVTVELGFHLHRSRLNGKIDDWTGKRVDRLRRVGDGFKIFQRHIYLDQTVIRSTNLSNLF